MRTWALFVKNLTIMACVPQSTQTPCMPFSPKATALTVLISRSTPRLVSSSSTYSKSSLISSYRRQRQPNLVAVVAYSHSQALPCCHGQEALSRLRVVPRWQPRLSISDHPSIVGKESWHSLRIIIRVMLLKMSIIRCRCRSERR